LLIGKTALTASINSNLQTLRVSEFNKLLTIANNKPGEEMMNKKTKKNNGIKDSISKLFILRDSCVGTCITQKDNPNIIWFEGAAILLEEGVDILKSAKQKIDSGGMDAGKDFSSSVKDTVSRLIVLKNSCRGDSSLEESDENTNWFAGAESIICEVIDQLQMALQQTGTQAVIPAAPKAADDSEDNDSVEAEKQAAAG
jgi:hypothetical protein